MLGVYSIGDAGRARRREEAGDTGHLTLFPRAI